MTFCGIAGFLVIAALIGGYLWGGAAANKSLRLQLTAFVETATKMGGGTEADDVWFDGYLAGVKATNDGLFPNR